MTTLKRGASIAESERSGTQSIKRAVNILKQIALRSRTGWRVSEIAAQCQLNKATAQRMISCLAEEGLLDRSGIDRRIRPGPLLFELGVSVPNYLGFVEFCQMSLVQLAKQVKGASYGLVLRSGYDGVYIAREGKKPLRGMVGYIGQRRPLILMGGGPAMLVRLPQEEVQDIVKRNLENLPHLSDDEVRAIKQGIRRARRDGYATIYGNTAKDSILIGLAIGGENGLPLAALTISGHQGDFPLSRIRLAVGALKNEALRIEQDFKNLHERES